MRKKSKFKSDVREAIYATVLGLYGADPIDARKLQRFKRICLTRYASGRVSLVLKKQTRS